MRNQIAAGPFTPKGAHHEMGNYSTTKSHRGRRADRSRATGNQK